MKIVRRKMIHFNTKHRSAGSTGDMTFNIPREFTATHDIDEILRITVCSLVLQRDWFNLSDSNNAVKVDDVTHTIPPGNYNITEVCLAISSETKITWSYSSITNSVSITSPNSFNVDFDVNSSMAEIVGFKNARYFDVTKVTGTEGVYIGTTKCLYLHSNIPISSLHSGEHGVAHSTILAVIEVNVAPHSNIVYDGGKNPLDTNIDALHGLRVWLSDDRGESITPNGDWVFSMELQYLIDDEAKMLELQQASQKIEEFNALSLDALVRYQKWTRFQ